MAHLLAFPLLNISPNHLHDFVKYARWLTEIYYALKGTTIKILYLWWERYLKLVSLQPKIGKSRFRNEPVCLHTPANWVRP